ISGVYPAGAALDSHLPVARPPAKRRSAGFLARRVLQRARNADCDCSRLSGALVENGILKGEMPSEQWRMNEAPAGKRYLSGCILHCAPCITRLHSPEASATDTTTRRIGKDAKPRRSSESAQHSASSGDHRASAPPSQYRDPQPATHLADAAGTSGTFPRSSGQTLSLP